ncbi:MAG: hypothetical protein MZV70_77570 [Desulfobacterales bacterium]|nr:hypothetical protein [Desulfobacterales bacterium]
MGEVLHRGSFQGAARISLSEYLPGRILVCCELKILILPNKKVVCAFNLEIVNLEIAVSNMTEASVATVCRLKYGVRFQIARRDVGGLCWKT